MTKLTQTLLLALTLFITACAPAPVLRLDDVSFGNKNTGLQAENPQFKPGDEYYFNYFLRGAAPDQEGMAKVSMTATLSHSKEPIHEFKEATYKINSEITSYGPSKPELHRIPRDAEGPGVLKIEVIDHVADNTLTMEIPYTVTK
ncbi:MAG: hypothetical protein KC800_15570 [Candidatus Eremiobacteraeota bacterium]|nr:hypothetical protein [Candidatus Eremiobacteraeota bacterium]